MSIYYNNKVIAGSSTPSSYRFVGEIFQSILPINDTKVHLLDGSLIYPDDGYVEFIQYLSSLQLLYPQLFCTEEVWQEKVAQYNEWGQFVLTSESVRLPKIISFVQGLSSLSDLATLVEAGLPNITGQTRTFGYASGCMHESIIASQVGGGSGANATVYFDASLSNSIYGNSDTVQPQAVRYPYYIVLATGVTQNIQSVQDITFNTPFFLGMYQYFDKELDNISWLKSTGQWYDKDLYIDYYNWILGNVNNSVNGFKLSTLDYTDYDFVLNTENNTFRLPIVKGERVLVVKKEATDDDPTWYNLYSDGWCEQGGETYATTGSTTVGTVYLLKKYKDKNYTVIGSKGEPDGVAVGFSCPITKEVDLFTWSIAYNNSTLARPMTWEAKGYTEIPQPSDYTENIGLYFYVGETIQNTSLINTGKLAKQISNIIPNNSELIGSYGNPDYDKAISLSTNTTFIPDVDGIVEYDVACASTNHWYLCLGESMTDTNRMAGGAQADAITVEFAGQVRVNKGVTYYIKSNGATVYRALFVPLKRNV